jgi:hypothetical protein
MPVVLSLEHVSKSFPGVKAMDDVRFDVQAGEVHALLGENGADNALPKGLIRDRGKIQARLRGAQGVSRPLRDRRCRRQRPPRPSGRRSSLSPRCARAAAKPTHCRERGHGTRRRLLLACG